MSSRGRWPAISGSASSSYTRRERNTPRSCSMAWSTAGPSRCATSFCAEARMTPSDSDWCRLHPSSLVLRAAAYAKKLVLPAVFVLVLARNGSWELWLLVAFVPAIAFEFFRYFTLRYRFGPEELIVRKGLIFRSERHIPFSRIQNINLLQGVLHRWFGVADVSIETAGGKEPEAILKVLSVDAVSQMRRRVFREVSRAAATTGSPESAATGRQPSEIPLEAAAPAPPRT